jgi:hypothetical protein
VSVTPAESNAKEAELDAENSGGGRTLVRVGAGGTSTLGRRNSSQIGTQQMVDVNMSH